MYNESCGACCLSVTRCCVWGGGEGARRRWMKCQSYSVIWCVHKAVSTPTRHPLQASGPQAYHRPVNHCVRRYGVVEKQGEPKGTRCRARKEQQATAAAIRPICHCGRHGSHPHALFASSSTCTIDDKPSEPSGIRSGGIDGLRSRAPHRVRQCVSCRHTCPLLQWSDGNGIGSVDQGSPL